MNQVMKEKDMSTTGPATHPSWAIAQPSDSTPDPITAVIMCALAVHRVPVPQQLQINYLSSNIYLLTDIHAMLHIYIYNVIAKTNNSVVVKCVYIYLHTCVCVEELTCSLLSSIVINSITVILRHGDLHGDSLCWHLLLPALINLFWNVEGCLEHLIRRRGDRIVLN